MCVCVCICLLVESYKYSYLCLSRSHIPARCLAVQNAILIPAPWGNMWNPTPLRSNSCGRRYKQCCSANCNYPDWERKLFVGGKWTGFVKLPRPIRVAIAVVERINFLTVMNKREETDDGMAVCIVGVQAVRWKHTAGIISVYILSTTQNQLALHGITAYYGFQSSNYTNSSFSFPCGTDLRVMSP